MKFNSLIPELSVSNLDKSLEFYVGIIGFRIEYARPEKRFAFLSLDGSQLMLDEDKERKNNPWYTGKMEYPRGRGIHFQISVKDIAPILHSLQKAVYPLKERPAEYWYRKGIEVIGMKGFLVQDPDGYLLMFNQDIGKKPIKLK